MKFQEKKLTIMTVVIMLGLLMLPEGELIEKRIEEAIIHPGVISPRQSNGKQRGTEVCNNITEDTTWTQDGNPYYIQRNIHIINKSTLFIGPGVEIIINERGALVSGLSKSKGGTWSVVIKIGNVSTMGNIIARGTSDNMINFRLTYPVNNDNTIIIGMGLESRFVFKYCSFYSVGKLTLFGSDDCIFDNCSFNGNSSIVIDSGHVGCPDTYPSNNTITSCNFIANYNSIDVKFETSSKFLPNKFYLNNFINNIFPLLGETTNIWNDSAGHGNYWSDYNGTDLNNDSIGDTNLPWHSVDWCPLMDPSPAINHCNRSWLDKPPDYDPTDKDGDGLPDIWEETHGLDPTDPWDANGDPDKDGVSNTAEYENNTDPQSRDTDGDYIDDKWEIDNGLNPTNPADAWRDVDNDGLSNIAELENNTDPFSNDTDDDGLPDGWEVINGLDPLNATDADMDFDNDGKTNLQEYEAGTNPLQPQSIEKDRKKSDVSFFLYFIIGIGIFLIVVIVILKYKK